MKVSFSSKLKALSMNPYYNLHMCSLNMKSSCRCLYCISQIYSGGFFRLCSHLLTLLHLLPQNHIILLLSHSLLLSFSSSKGLGVDSFSSSSFPASSLDHGCQIHNLFSFRAGGPFVDFILK